MYRNMFNTIFQLWCHGNRQIRGIYRRNIWRGTFLCNGKFILAFDYQTFFNYQLTNTYWIHLQLIYTFKLYCLPFYNQWQNFNMSRSRYFIVCLLNNILLFLVVFSSGIIANDIITHQKTKDEDVNKLRVNFKPSLVS